MIADLPTQSGSFFVIAQHVSASHRSMMAEILSRQTRLPVQEVVTDTQPLPNVIYTVPPGFNLVFQQGRFCLSQPSPEVSPKPSINLL
ncbi:MAG: chemotaxis protein CheB, partial [Rhodoferax sp.]